MIRESPRGTDVVNDVHSSRRLPSAVAFSVPVAILIGPALPQPIGLRPDQLLAATLGILAFIHFMMSRTPARLSPGSVLVWTFLLLVALTTVINLLHDASAHVTLARATGLAVGPILFLASERLGLLQRGSTQGLQWGIGVGLLVVALIATAQAYGVSWIVELTAQSYTSGYRSPFGALLSAEGRLVRSVGTMESPAATGSAMLIGMALGINIAQRTSGFHRIVGIIVTVGCIVGGISTSSSTFLAGAPLVLVVMALLALFSKERRRRPSVGGGLGLTMIGVSILSILSAGVSLSPLSEDYPIGDTAYQLGRISSGEVLVSRYGSDARGRSMAFELARDSLYLGAGATDNGEMVGDSLFLTLLVLLGLPGLLILVAAIIWAGRFAIHYRDFATQDAGRYVAGVIGILAGAGVATLFAPRLGAIMWLCLPVPVSASVRTPIKGGRSQTGGQLSSGDTLGT